MIGLTCALVRLLAHPVGVDVYRTRARRRSRPPSTMHPPLAQSGVR